MAQPSQEDILAPFDPTAYTTIDGAQLYQLVSGATPYSDKGMVVMTADVAGHGQPPDAVGTPKWQNYVWRRVSATSTSLYLWNNNAAPYIDPNTGDNFQQWYPIATASIPAGGILGYMIANLTITDANIANLNWSKIVGAPTWVLVGGAAGGALSGVYPNPSIANAAVTGVMLANNTVGHLNLVTQTGDDTQAVVPNANTTNAPVNPGNNIVVPTGAATNDLMVVNATTKGFTTQTGTTLWPLLSIAAVGAANGIPQINAGGTAWQLSTPAQVAASLKTVTTFTSAGNALSAGGGLIVNTAHGLGATPTKVQGWLVCVTGNAGYTAGDQIDFLAVSNSAGGQAVSIGVNATNVFASNLNMTLEVIHKTTGAQTNITNADWTVTVIATL